MARAAAVLEAAPEVDAIDGLPLPRERDQLIGHEAAERALLDAYRSGRIHHAWILGGLKGIGKATLAFRFARFVLAHPDPRAAAVAAARDLAVPAEHPVARRIAAGAHIDLLHLRRPWDDKAKRFKTELPVDEVRKTVGFFGSTAGEGGWRVAIVDAADDLNANAANALLKILEEPPPRSLFLVVAHQPGRLLPTIRSRCRRLDMDGLDSAAVSGALAEFGFDDDPATAVGAAELADGSIRRAILLVENDGTKLWRMVEELTRDIPKLDGRALHALADQLVGKGSDERFEIAMDFLDHQIAARAAAAAENGRLARAAALAEALSDIRAMLGRADALNLDRKAAVLAAFRRLAEAAGH